MKKLSEMEKLAQGKEMLDWSTSVMIGKSMVSDVAWEESTSIQRSFMSSAEPVSPMVFCSL